MIDDDGYRLRSIERSMLRSELEGKSVQHALETHPVVRYVLNLPVESPAYPANRYLRFVNTDDQGNYTDFSGNPTTQQSIEDRMQERITDHITWQMPGHDTNRPQERGCGFIRASDDTLVYTACPDDHDHHCKAKRKHCWSLKCPKCMNDTALRKAVRVEKQFLCYSGLIRKSGGDAGHISHFVVSPPQDFMKSAMQSFTPFDAVCRHIESQLMKHGATAGFNVFHPWRQTYAKGKGEYWQLSPHFHCLLYGFINTTVFRKENPGWVIKKVHARERIRSIRHTVAYLMTHMGIGEVDVDPDEVDWDLDILDYLIPGLKSPGAHYSEKDYNQLAEGRGRMAGDLSDIDWEQWVKDRLSKDLRTRYWGGVSRKNIVNVDNYRQYRIRVCRECGSLLRTYDGFTDTDGKYVRYIADHPIVAFRNNAVLVRQFFQRYKSSLPEGMTLCDLASMIPTAICTAEFDMERNNPDIIMPGPFDEPDEFFLKRQRRAFGPVQ